MKKRQALAITALSKIIRLSASKYQVLTALKRCGSNEALADAFSSDPERHGLEDSVFEPPLTPPSQLKFSNLH